MLFRLSAALLLAIPFFAARAGEFRQASGVKVGEVTDTSAIVWLRRTRDAERNKGELPAYSGEGYPEKHDGACPGAAGKLRLRYGKSEDLKDAAESEWAAAEAEHDFCHSFKLEKLDPATKYFFAAETANAEGEPDAPLRGSFTTAPKPDAKAPVSFTVITGQAYRTVDDPAGHKIYPAMQKLAPSFFVSTGDTVYYDNDKPNACTVEQARYHWHRIYSLPRIVEFHLNVPSYWEKDDHDTLCNDSWPTMNNKKNPPLKWDEGLALFREQVPMSEKTYRTFRWGKGLQVWLVEGRDFRSANNDGDSPEKTIWGAEQKAWLFKSIAESDADWRILISPTPIVGPDRPNKRDNHANDGFAIEGKEVRAWIAKQTPKNLFVVCGDRHWQYYSVDPETGVHEFCSGPTSDKHAGGSPGEEKNIHKYHKVCGGFLSVSVTYEDEKSAIAFRHHDVDGKVVNEVKP